MTLAAVRRGGMTHDALGIPATRDGVSRAAAWLQTAGGRLGIGGEILYRVDVCLEETLANLVDHARLVGDARIDIEIARQGDEALLTVVDGGIAFDPNRYCDAGEAVDLASASVGGRGIRLIRALADKIEYGQRDSRNRLTLRFRPRNP